jgi:uncharacterized membrane protein (DUF106 family)
MLESITTIIQSYPLPSIILAAILISFFISLVNYFVLDKEKMHALKAKQKALQEEMKLHKDNPTKLMDLQKEMFSHMGENFKHSLKPMLITFIPLMLLFPFLRKALMETALAGTWFWWYIGVSLASSLVFRKWFKLP